MKKDWIIILKNVIFIFYGNFLLYIFFPFSSFKEDQRIEKMSKRSTDLETACNNARLLAEMIAQFNKNSAAQQEVEIMKVKNLCSTYKVLKQ